MVSHENVGFVHISILVLIKKIRRFCFTWFFYDLEFILHIICHFYVSNSIYNLSIFPDSTVCECFKFFLPRLIFRWNLPISLWQIVFLQFPEILKKNEHFWYSLREKWVSLKVFRVSWCFIKNKKKTKSCSIKT